MYNIFRHSFFTWVIIDNKIQDETKSDNPPTQKSIPEIVLNGSRIFEPDDEDVSGDDDGYEEHDSLPH